MEKKQTTNSRQIVTIKKNYFEKHAWEANTLILGLDEVGRGCFAGPVVSAAVILPPNTSYRLLKDSKIMIPEERVKAYKWIINHCVYGIGITHHRIIDTVNIRQATFISMKKAALNALILSPYRPSAIVVDAMPLSLANTSFADIPVHHFNFGESKSISIAAASIVAKVTRDAMMDLFDPLFPGYGLLRNKGYGTAFHQEGLSSQGHSLIHRMSFLKKHIERSLNKNFEEGIVHEQQGELFR
jgi:ribonuclease HII